MVVVVETATKASRFAHFWQGAESVAPATQSSIRTSKSAPNPSVFYTFDFEMCFAPQRRALFNISTSSGPDLVIFIHFDFDMCFAPQRRATFHLSSDLMAPHPPL